MSYFARVPNISGGVGEVTDVIRADQDFINTGLVGNPFEWIQTRYNMYGGVYYLPDSNIPDPDQSKALRANYAGIGFTYDSINDVFYDPRPSNQTGVFYSWTISAPTWLWQPPIPYPTTGGAYYWDEQTLSWVPVP
jgi:hypothetical protein